MAKRRDKEQEKINALVKEEIESRKKLAELQKNMNQDIAGYINQLVMIKEGKEKIKEIDDEITKLNKEKEELSGKELKTAKATIKELKKNKAEMVKINTAAEKINSMWKSVGNSIKKSVVETIEELNNKLKDSIPGFWDIVGALNEADLAMKETARDMGLAGASAESLRNSIGGAASYAAALGVSVDQMARAQANFAEATGAAAVFSKQLNMDLVKVAKGTGMSMEDSGVFAANLSLAGMSMNDSLGVMQGVVDRSAKLGLNTGEVAKKLKDNLVLMNKMHFKDGIEGLEKLIQVSQKFRIELASIEALTQKIFRPEGAIELAANLQMMGGAFSRMGDPMTLMFQARNAPDELAKNIAKATAESAIFNKETGKFSFSALEMDRLRQIADMTGISIEELTKSSIRAAKALKIKSQFNFDPAMNDFISTVAEFDKKKGGFAITMPNGQTKLIKEMTRAELESMQAREKDLEKRAELALSFDKAFGNFMNSLKVAFLPVLEYLNVFTEVLADWATSFGKAGKLGKILIATAVLVGLTIATTAGTLLPRLLSKGFGAITGSLSKAMGLASKSPAGGGGFFKSFFKGLQKVDVSKILAFGLAMVMIGAAVAIAAVGMAELVKAFGGLDIPQMIGATIAITLLGVGLLALIPAITAFAATAGVTATPIMGLGFGLLMIGGAVFLAATGFANLVESFKGMEPTQMLAMGGGLALIGVGIYALSTALVAAAAAGPLALVGIAAVSVALIALGAATQSLNTGALESISNLAGMSSEKIDKLKALFEYASKAKPLHVIHTPVVVSGTITLDTGDSQIDISVDGNASKKLADVVQSQLFLTKEGTTPGVV